MSGKPDKKKSEQANQADSKATQTAKTPVTASALTGHYQPLAQPSPSPESDPAASGVVGDDKPTLPESNVATLPDVEVLLVQAVSPNGFYRAGLFWPHDGVNVFVSDTPDADNAESQAEDAIAPFISTETADRLKAEPHLRVTVLPTVIKDQGE
ncbi:hypothetical protein [Serratia marcescens]|uniref:hypothetical protein n=1 Tax=Serratia TaxID=613 RepID=UPI0018D7B523|nr:hypothetical protein [Serratia marcescens]MBH3241396.1 hypothetical protein [Serratia marcescens]MBN5409386.1 hypothetical protein [Serratia marcescens]HAT5012301.1 hypothetical protein [Serratia marcescens]HAT5014106.1 hypothetical protein [Serratia marcescens]